MSRVGFESCNFKEYEDGERYRVREDDLSTDGLYTVMFSFKAMRALNKAVKCAGRVIDIEVRNDGLLYDVRFSLLDNNLEPAREMENAFWEGYLLAKGDSATVINLGYFREYGSNPTNQELDGMATANQDL